MRRKFVPSKFLTSLFKKLDSQSSFSILRNFIVAYLSNTKRHKDIKPYRSWGQTPNEVIKLNTITINLYRIFRDNNYNLSFLMSYTISIQNFILYSGLSMKK